jgi:hypothetical protein
MLDEIVALAVLFREESRGGARGGGSSCTTSKITGRRIQALPDRSGSPQRPTNLSISRWCSYGAVLLFARSRFGR